MRYRDFARSFMSDIGIEQMRSILNGSGPWSWIDRDNDQWGPYISAGVLTRPQRGIVKIYFDDNPENIHWHDVKPSDGRFIVAVNLASDDPDAETIFADIERTVLERVLPSVGAREIKETETP